MARPRATRLTLVYAPWCPHSVPISTELAPQLAEHLAVPLRLLNIDLPTEEARADVLVRDHGDWSDDYLIPQLFLELSDGTVRHLLTGAPGSTEETRRRWGRLIAAPPEALVAGEVTPSDRPPQ